MYTTSELLAVLKQPMKKPDPRRARIRRESWETKGTAKPKAPDARIQTARKASFCQGCLTNLLELIFSVISERSSLKTTPVIMAAVQFPTERPVHIKLISLLGTPTYGKIVSCKVKEVLP